MGNEFQLLGYRVSEISCSLDDSCNPEDIGVISQELDVVNQFDPTRPNFVQVEITVRLKDEGNKFKFLVVVKGGFQKGDGVSDELFARLAAQNAPAVLYPFVRALVASFTAQAFSKLIMLPLFNFTKINPNEMKDKE